MYDGALGTHQGYDGTPRPWEFARVWPLEPSLTDPDTVYAGVEDAALCRSTDGGQTWQELPARRGVQGHLSRTGGYAWEALTTGLPQRDCYVNVVRDAMAVDALEACGVYVGTTGGQVYASADGGDRWAPVVRDLPTVVSVEVQTPP